jgi:predicted NAD/FAD-dependent oxidoreductase
MSKRHSCLIVGAGLAGLTAAELLQKNGWDVVVLDKGRGPGGRMATRRIGASSFDHGAQFFTVRDNQFQSAVDRWEAAGWIQTWFTEGGHIRYRGAGGMNRIAKELSKRLTVHSETTVVKIETLDQGWRTITAAGDAFATEAILLTAPAPQSAALIAACQDVPEEARAILDGIVYEPCFALLVSLDGPSLVPSPGYVRPETGPISFIADNSQKGVSPGIGALTIHAQVAFTRAHMDTPREEVMQLLVAAARPFLGGRVEAWQLHYWKHSQATATYGEPCLFFTRPAPIAFAGDGFGAPRIEGAFLSGLAAAQKIMSRDGAGGIL